MNRSGASIGEAGLSRGDGGKQGAGATVWLFCFHVGGGGQDMELELAGDDDSITITRGMSRLAGELDDSTRDPHVAYQYPTLWKKLLLRCN